MNQSKDSVERVDVLKRALIEIRELRSQVDALRRRASEPVALIGIGCRFPGQVDSPHDLWQFLCQGRDGTGPIPPDRWDIERYYDPDPASPGKMYTRRGGFIDDVYGFDARFFNLSQREAASLDPQQRLFLQVAWAALEDAAIAPASLAGSRSGVFLGVSGSDYAHLLTERIPAADLDAYVGTGTAYSFAPGRLSYFLGLTGPSVALDTACSSSLVAVHLACQSLRDRECDLALAGGVNLILTPTAHIVLSKARVLAPDGRCKTFDQSADGYARSEGCGVVVLRRLADALERNDPILAVLRGSAVNQDGPSSGLTVPSALAQQAVIRAALAAAGLRPDQVDYVEAHGTGTQLGDPIEVRSLAAALGAGRTTDRPLLIGSIKTNLGHLEAASGVAGLIKAALSVYHGELPAHLHVQTENPHIDWGALPVQVVGRRRAWPTQAADRERIAGVSSFGASGTNAHVILSSPPPGGVSAGRAGALSTQSSHADSVEASLLPLSAQSEAALRALCDRYERYLASQPSVSLTALCQEASVGRSHLSERLCLRARHTSELRQQLAAYLRFDLPEGAVRARCRPSEPPRLVFLFSGPDALAPGLGQMLLQTQPVFQKVVERCDAIVGSQLPHSLTALLSADADLATPLRHPLCAGPALFALQVGLCAQWQAWGIAPHAVLGYGLGELAAAHVAGLLSLEDALRWVVAVARGLAALPPDGGMALLYADAATAAELVEQISPQLSLAAYHAPGETVIAGPRAELDRALARCQAAGLPTQPLPGTLALHSPWCDPLLSELQPLASQLGLQPPRIPLFSAQSGGLLREEQRRPDYFLRQLRQPVRFEHSVQQVQAHGTGQTLYLEIGPGALLGPLARRCLPDAAAEFVPSLPRPSNDRQPLLGSLAKLYCHGVAIDWQAVQGPRTARLWLPTYSFQTSPFPPPPESSAPPPGEPATAPQATHGLLGRRLRSPLLADSHIVYQAELAAADHPLLADHRVYGQTVVSGVIHLSWVLAALTATSGSPGGVEFSAVQFLQPLLLPSSQARRTIQTLLTMQSADEASFAVVSQSPAAAGSAPFVTHTTGQLRRLPVPPKPVRVDVAAIQARCPETCTGADFYASLWRADEHELGPSFRTITRLQRRDGEALAELRLPDDESLHASRCGLGPHWAQNASIGEVYGQALLPALPGYAQLAADRSATFLGQSVDHSHDFQLQSHRAAYCHAQLRTGDGDSFVGDLALLDAEGQVLAQIVGLRVRRVGRTLLQQALRASRGPALPSLQAEPGGLQALTPEFEQQLYERLRARLAAVIGADESQLQPGDSLSGIGLDSLMAVDLRDALLRDLGVEISVEQLLSGDRIRDLHGRVLSQIRAAQSGAAPARRDLLLTAPPAPARPELAASPPNNEPQRNESSSLWLRRISRGPRKQVRLVAFPHAGAGASAFQLWQASLAPEIDLHAVQLPGREDRLREPTLSEIPRIVEQLQAVLPPHLSEPFAFFGISMGAIVAFELTRALRQQGGPQPLHLFLAACPAPHVANPLIQRTADLRRALASGDPAAVPLLRRHGMLPEALLRPDVLEIVLPSLQADLEAVHRYALQPAPPLDLPVTILGGRDDGDVYPEALAAWSQHTSGPFLLHMQNGGHLFYRTHAGAVLDVLRRALT